MPLENLVAQVVELRLATDEALEQVAVVISDLRKKLSLAYCARCHTRFDIPLEPILGCKVEAGDAEPVIFEGELSHRICAEERAAIAAVDLGPGAELHRLATTRGDAPEQIPLTYSDGLLEQSVGLSAARDGE